MSHGLTEADAVALTEEVNELLKISQWHQDQALNGAGWAASHAADTAAQLASAATELARKDPIVVPAVLDEIHAGLVLLLQPGPPQEAVFSAQRHKDRARTRAALHQLT